MCYHSPMYGAQELRSLFALLWQRYTSMTPAAVRINRLLEARGENIINDHIALRTFDRELVGIESLDRAFVAGGYEPVQHYEFPSRKLVATHYEHPEAGMPKVFISALLLDEMSNPARELVDGLLAKVERGRLARWDFAASGRLWPLSYSDYQTLQEQSDYAAWVAAFGFCANHFTISVNDLKTFDSLADLNSFLTESGVRLSEIGGQIKGSPSDLLLQSSTMAEAIQVDFDDQSCAIPSGYYEFAYRYHKPSGERFQGFVPESAHHLFDSTTTT